MKVMVTGAAGFIGSHLVDRLISQGHKVIAVDDLSSGSLANISSALENKEAVTFHSCDVASDKFSSLIRSTAPDLVMHLAAQVDVRRSVADPVEDARVNLLGTVNLLQSCRESATGKVIFATSGGCIYGEPGEDLIPVKEDLESHPSAQPKSPYGVSKKAALTYLRYFREIQGIDFTALALANVYGPRQEPSSEVGLEGQVVAIFIRRMLESKPCTIYGDGTQTRDLVFVADVVDAFIAAVDSGSGEVINIGTGVETTVNQLYGALARMTGSRGEPLYQPARPGELYRIALSHEKAGKILGWKPVTSLEDGLKKTLDWFRSRPQGTV